METKLLKEDQIAEASEILLNGEVLAFPTETVFGLGVIYDSFEAFNKLVEAKKRPADKPFTLMCSDVSQIEKVAILDEKAKKIINKLMPGELTMLLKPKDDIYPWVNLNTSKIGVRIPNHSYALSLIKQVGKPLLVPSANPSNESPALDYLDALNYFDGKISGIVKSESKKQKPSTIIDLTGIDIKLIREGNITLNDILKVLED
ncbi:MAG: threonylcarbamoyl-AMP synthase [Erysipelotrichales bacterium]|nr:threonylcarbamoyl-AMP synthase [Erysipelotrichales bacterium]